jgi:DEAD/DEAH box helicase domain-containing protein
MTSVRGHTILDSVTLDTPPYERETTGWWLDIPKEVLDISHRKGLNVAEGIHAASHAVLNQFNMGNEVKTECKLARREYKSEPTRRKRPAR